MIKMNEEKEEDLTEEEKIINEKIKNAVPIKNYKKILLKHEKELYEKGELFNITHQNSKCILLERYSNKNLKENQTNVYRPCGDKEVLYLLEKGILPNTQVL
jgi:hypothetical protein